jgi:hypothetical protein
VILSVVSSFRFLPFNPSAICQFTTCTIVTDASRIGPESMFPSTFAK